MASTKRQWIDIGKCIAILAVIVDHCFGFLYHHPAIAHFSYFSVTLFVFMGGVTSYYSNRRHRAERGPRETLRRVNTLLIPYAVATAVCLVLATGSLWVPEYLRALVAFSASPPLYFVLFYVQLTIVSPWLFDLIRLSASRRYPVLAYTAVGVALALVGWLLTRYTFVAEVHGGGRVILGGTYLLFYYLGMLMGSFDPRIRSLAGAGAGAVVSLAAVGAWFWWVVRKGFALDTFIPVGGGLNPPGITLGVFAILLGAFIFCITTVIERIQFAPLTALARFAARIGGGYSLYIFLYHFSVLQLVYDPIARLGNIWLTRVVVVAAMVFVPVIGARIYAELRDRARAAVRALDHEPTPTPPEPDHEPTPTPREATPPQAPPSPEPTSTPSAEVPT
jgi:fucose 4-O-acetylase-like acetyltransferase